MVTRTVSLPAIDFFIVGRKLAVFRCATAGAAVGVVAGVSSTGVGVEPVLPPAELSALSAPQAAVPRISGRATTAAVTRVRNLTFVFLPGGSRRRILRARIPAWKVNSTSCDEVRQDFTRA